MEGVQFCHSQKESPYSYSIHSISRNSREIFSYLDTLVREIRQRAADYSFVCQNLTELILVYIARNTNQNFLAAPTRKASRECRMVEQYINENFAHDITLETLSSLVHINKYYLVHAFKNYKGMSPINYLIQKRVEEVRHLLEATNYPVTKIGKSPAFPLSLIFPRLFGKSPGFPPILTGRNGSNFAAFRKTCLQNSCFTHA